MTSDSYTADLSHTGQFHVGLRSFICRYSDASKHCRCEQVDARHGVVMRILPSGQTSDTFSMVVAMSQSASSFSFSRTTEPHKTIVRICRPQIPHPKPLGTTLTQHPREVGWLDALGLQAVQQLRRGQLLDQAGGDDVGARIFGAPRHIDLIGHRRRQLHVSGDVDRPRRTLRLHARLVGGNGILWMLGRVFIFVNR